MSGTLVTNLRHYLNDDGELKEDIPSEARQMASFLALIVDATSAQSPEEFLETGIRCRAAECRGKILARVEKKSLEIHWECPLCGHHGLITNWQDTKWDLRPN